MASNPQAFAPRLSLSGHYSRTGQHRKIIELLSPLRSTNADNPAVRGLLGESELAVGDYKKSVEDLSGFVELAPNNIAGQYALARAYAGVQDRDRFYQQLNKVLEMDENHMKARSDLVKLMLIEKNIEEAKKALFKLDVLFEEHSDIYHAGFFEHAQQEFAEASILLSLLREEEKPEILHSPEALSI